MKQEKRSFLWTLLMVALCVGWGNSALAATTYYVSPNNSSNSYAGTIDRPWRTLGYAGGQLSNGDTLVLRGGTYKKQSMTIRVPNVTVRNQSGETPVIDGDYNHPTGAGYPSDYPAVLYMPIIRVIANNVTIDGITITESRGNGIETNALNFVIRNCNITYSQHIGISIKDVSGVENGLIENNVVKYSNFARDNGAFNQWGNIVCNIAVRGSYNTVRGNTIAYCTSAGLEGYRDDHSVYENNIIYGNRLTQIHEAESRYCTIRNNLIYGMKRAGVKDVRGYGTGVELMCELWYNGNNWDYGHEVYGNMIASTQIGIRIGWQTGAGRTYPTNAIRDVKIYNNTIVEPYTTDTYSFVRHAIVVMGNKDSEGYSHLGGGNVIKNNVLWQSSGDLTFEFAPSAKVDMGHNLWSKAPTESYRNWTDTTFDAGYPTLKMADYLSKTSGWKNLTEGSLKASDFDLRPTAYYAIGQGTSTPVASPAIDFLNVASGKWDIGASIYGEGNAALIDDGTKLSAPTLSIVGSK